MNIATTFAIKEGKVYSDTEKPNSITLRDFSASHRAILKEIAKELKDPRLESAETLGRFNRMPKEIQQKIHALLIINCQINLPQCSPETYEMTWRISSSLQKSQAIEKYLKSESSTT